jgi:hypothetical protein
MEMPIRFFKYVIGATIVVLLLSCSMVPGTPQSAAPEGTSGTPQGIATEGVSGTPEGTAPESMPATPPRSAAPEGWVQHRDPLGFVVSHPSGWTVETTEEGSILVRSADKSALVLIQPFYLREAVTAKQYVGKVPTLIASLFPQASIERSQQRLKQPDEVIATMTYQAQGGPGQANILCSIGDRSGMLFAIAAPKEQFEEMKESLVSMLKTFSFTEPSEPVPGVGATPNIEYVKWQDPKENAFSLEVPRGWEVSGGMFRFASVDTRTAVEVLSPDGQIRITAGDAEIPTFVLPDQLLQSTGFPEGSWYSPGYGVTMMVMHYLSGVEFAEEYVKTKVAKGCSELTFEEKRDRPDVAEAINNIHAQYNLGTMSITLNTGEVAFTCQKDSEAMRGYYFAGTQLTTGYGAEGSGLWNVQFLFGYLAAAPKADLAQAVLSQMITSFRPNPEWVRRQQNLTAETSEIVARTHAEISEMIDQAYWNRQRTQDEQLREWSNTILGQTDLTPLQEW